MNASEGKVTIITGADTDMGAACAIAASAKGSPVLLAGKDKDKMQKTAEMILNASGRCHICVLDLTDPEQAAELPKAAVENLGRPAILITTPRIYHQEALHETKADKIREIIDENLISCINAMKALLGAFGRSGGVIVNIASTAAIRGHVGTGAYSASMGAIAAVSREAAVEYSVFDVRVNCILPGIIKTDEYREIRSRNEPEYEKKLIRHIPQGRVGRPEEVAKVAMFLSSDDASYISGAAIPVDGGYSAM